MWLLGHNSVTSSCFPADFHHHWLLCYLWVSAEVFFFDEPKCGWCSHRGKRSVCKPLQVETLTDLLWGALVGSSHSTQPPYCCQTHPRVKAWHSETLTVTLPHRGRMVVAQSRTNETIGEGLAELQKELEVGGGEDRNCTITKQYRFKKVFEKT